MANSRQYEGYVSEDYPAEDHWLRTYCVPMDALGCGLVLFQHHFAKQNDFFDHTTEANIGVVSAGTIAQAFDLIRRGQAHLGYHPHVIRRIDSKNILTRAGWRQEDRQGTHVYILDL